MQFRLEVDEAAVEGFLRAFGTDAEASPRGWEGIRTKTQAGLESLAGRACWSSSDSRR
jgi:hypothetical protein